MDMKQVVKKWTDNELLMEFEEVILDMDRTWTRDKQDDYEAIKSEIRGRMSKRAN